MNKDYLDVSRVQDLNSLREKILYRTLEIFPGFLSWGALISAIFLSWLAPVVVAIFIILFDLYWLLKISYLSFHQIASFIQMKKNLKIDWLEKLSQIKNWKEIYHLIILPLYKEKKEMVEESLKAMLDSKYPKDKMIIVLALEERADGDIQKMAEEIGESFLKKFFKFLVTIHPKDLPGEIAGKGSNIAFAVKEAKEKIIGPLKIPSENIIVSCFDIDTKPYPHYFSCLTFHYLTAKKPQKSSYQPIPVYNNNIWQVPAFSRVVATSGTFWQMMQQERPEMLSTFSSHSMPFKILEEVGYPKNVVSDDSRIFWKAYLFYDSDYRVVPLYYPVSMDAVLSKNLPRTIINQYKQQRRWAWGCADIPFLFFGFFKNTKISLSEKLRHSINILDGFWSWATCSLLIFFLGWLPLILGGEKFNITLLSYNLPRLVSNLMTLAMVGMIISGILSFKILPPRPPRLIRFGDKPKNRVPRRGVLRDLSTPLETRARHKKLNRSKHHRQLAVGGKLRSMFLTGSMVFQWLLLPITLIFFGALPALDAQARLMLGKHLGFWATEKIRRYE